MTPDMQRRLENTLSRPVTGKWNNPLVDFVYIRKVGKDVEDENNLKRLVTRLLATSSSRLTVGEFKFLLERIGYKRDPLFYPMRKELADIIDDLLFAASNDSLIPYEAEIFIKIKYSEDYLGEESIVSTAMLIDNLVQVYLGNYRERKNILVQQIDGVWQVISNDYLG